MKSSNFQFPSSKEIPTPKTGAAWWETVRCLHRLQGISLCSRAAIHKSRSGFTLFEIMLSIFIFAMVLTAIYSTWIAIMRGTKAGLTAAAEVQRSRVAVRTVEQALATAQMFYGPNNTVGHYGFFADTAGEYAELSMASRLSASFPGVGRYGAGDLAVRRVSFSVRPSPDGKNELVMTQAPILMDTNQSGAEAYELILAKDVTEFTCEFWDDETRDWSDEWIYTNKLPRLARTTLGLGKTKGSSEPHDLVTRIVPLSGQQTGPQIPRNRMIGTR